MAVSLVKKSGTATIAKTFPDGSQEESQEKVAGVIASRPTATVTVGASFTKNLGNYQSCKVTVELAMPCLPEHKDETFAETSAWVNKRMEELIESLND